MDLVFSGCSPHFLSLLFHFFCLLYICIHERCIFLTPVDQTKHTRD